MSGILPLACFNSDPLATDEEAGESEEDGDDEENGDKINETQRAQECLSILLNDSSIGRLKYS